MATMRQVRAAIATNLDTVTGLKVASRVPEVIAETPLAVVMPASIEYDKAFGRGADTYEIRVVVFAGRMDSRAAEELLDGFANSTGSTSLKAAIESDPDLGGSAFDLRVTSMREVGPATVGETAYLTATFLVSVATI